MCSSHQDVGTLGGFAGLVLPLSRMSCSTGIPSLIGTSWEEVYSFVDRESLSWAKLDSPAGIELSKAVPAVMGRWKFVNVRL